MVGEYILGPDNEVVPVDADGGLEWARWMENNRDRKRVAETTVVVGDKTFWVSTVFLGLEHNFGMGGPPVVFETMVFDRSPGAQKGRDLAMERYCTWEQAKDGHESMVHRVEIGDVS